jgi:hypothetical protein
MSEPCVRNVVTEHDREQSDYESIASAIKGCRIGLRHYETLVNLLKSCVATKTASADKIRDARLMAGESIDTLRREDAELAALEKIEAVDHPQHYGGDVPHEVYKCLRAWGLELDAMLWTAVKYIARAGKKSPDKIQDLKKARWYLDNRIQQLEGEASENS